MNLIKWLQSLTDVGQVCSNPWNSSTIFVKLDFHCLFFFYNKRWKLKSIKKGKIPNKQTSEHQKNNGERLKISQLPALFVSLLFPIVPHCPYSSFCSWHYTFILLSFQFQVWTNKPLTSPNEQVQYWLGNLSSLQNT
jgi:hypothetical protein